MSRQKITLQTRIERFLSVLAGYPSPFPQRPVDSATGCLPLPSWTQVGPAPTMVTLRRPTLPRLGGVPRMPTTPPEHVI